MLKTPGRGTSAQKKLIKSNRKSADTSAVPGGAQRRNEKNLKSLTRKEKKPESGEYAHMKKGREEMAGVAH